MKYRFDDSGQVAGIEVLPFGFLILVIGALLLANAWAVVDTKMAVTAAAREAARAYAEAPDAETAAAAASTRLNATMTGQGHDEAALISDIQLPFGWARCAPVEITVQTDIRAIGLPFIGGFGRSFTVGAQHREIIDPYRSGFVGEARCG